MITTCETCDHVHSATRKSHPGRWLCVKFPRIEGWSPVAPKVWADTEPYMRCVGINGGLCPLFVPVRTKSESTHTEGT